MPSAASPQSANLTTEACTRMSNSAGTARAAATTARRTISLCIQQIYSTTIIKSLGRRRQRHLRQLDLGHLDQGGLGRHGQRVDAAPRQRDLGDGLLAEGLLRDDGRVEDQRGHLADRARLVLCQQSLGEPAVLLALGVLLHRVLHADLPAREELAIHLGDGGVGAVEVVVADEAVALAAAVLGVARDLGADDHAEVAEGLVEELLVDLGVEVADEDVGADVLGAFVLRGLVDLDGLAVELDHVHDLDGVVGVLLALELDEAVALVLVGDLVARDVHVHHRAALREQLPQDVLVHLLVDVPRVHRRLLVPLVQRGDQRHLLLLQYQYHHNRGRAGGRAGDRGGRAGGRARQVRIGQQDVSRHGSRKAGRSGQYKYYSYHWLFLARIRPIASSRRQLMACSTGMAVSSPSPPENISGLCSLHSPIVQTRSSLAMNLARKRRWAARAATERRSACSTACRMNSQLTSVKSAWYFSRKSSKVSSCGSLTRTQISPWVQSWQRRETAGSMARSSISRQTASSRLSPCMRSAVTSLIATATPTSSSTARNIRQCSRAAARPTGRKRSSTECRMMMDSSITGVFSPRLDLLAMDFETIVSLSQMFSRFSPYFFLRRRTGESHSRSKMLDCVGLNSCASTQSRSQFDRTYFISFSPGRRMMLWLTSFAYSFRNDSSFFSSSEQLCENSEQPYCAIGTWLQLLQLSRSSDSEASSLRCREVLNLRSRVLRRLYSRLFRMLSSTLLRPLLRRKLERFRGLNSTSILGSLPRRDSTGRLAFVVRVISFLRGRKPRRGTSSSARRSLASAGGSAGLGRGDISAQVILLSTMRGESQSSRRVALSLRLSAALELVRLALRESFLELVREARLAGEGWFWAASLIERLMPVRLGAAEWLSRVWRAGSSWLSVLEGESASWYLSSCESTKCAPPADPKWQWFTVWQIFTVLQRLNISPPPEILDLLIIIAHFIQSNKYIYPPSHLHLQFYFAQTFITLNPAKKYLGKPFLYSQTLGIRLQILPDGI